MDEPQIIYALDLLGTASFAFSGILRGFHRKPDPVGMAIIAGATALGGGTVRDVILDRPPSMIADPAYLVVILATVGISALFPRLLQREEGFFKYADAAGLGIFSAIGATLAWDKGLNPLAVVFVAALTGAGGGVVRDVLLGEMPLVMYKDIYISAVAAGALALLAVRWAGGGPGAGFVAAMVVTIAIRVLALLRRWSLPRVSPP